METDWKSGLQLLGGTYPKPTHLKLKCSHILDIGWFLFEAQKGRRNQDEISFLPPAEDPVSFQPQDSL